MPRPLLIGAGRYEGALAGFPKGAVDEIALFERVLSAEEISRLHAAPGEALPGAPASFCTPGGGDTPATIPAPPAERWMHLSVVHDARRDVAELYVNGFPACTAETEGIPGGPLSLTREQLVGRPGRKPSCSAGSTVFGSTTDLSPPPR
ncbi:laminin G domain-containing protein [Streptomyces sp. ST2-7A]|uniref:laminin G domain-containing protein n=1 Tax=Streptomyces sp. ST2-7A TaxID=2907214 RepID=UPI001F3E617F|nr:laminin G domain-containing protein [Streptomyces sp. ST2-7A]MCE7079206.1 laminin G domain-containing protein [Streptomyces sp. ST2-7A]